MPGLKPRNILWAALEAGLSGGLSLLSALVIARLVGPSEFGIAAASIAPHVALWVVANALFADALVQRPQLDETTVDSAVWASLAVGAACAGLQLLAGLVLARSLADARLPLMGALLALPLPLVGPAGVAQGLLTREQRYRSLAARSCVGQGLGTTTGLLLALCHAGAWALVAQQFVMSIAGAATLLLAAGLRLRQRWHWDAVRHLLRLGLPLTASTLLLAVRYRLFAMLLAGAAGPTTLGEAHMAFRLVDTVRELGSTALWRLILPVLAELQHDEAALRAAVDRLVRLTSAALLPGCGLMALCLPGLVRFALGPAWVAAAQAAAPLIALMAVVFVMFPAGVAVVARGQTARPLIGNAACLALTVGGVALLRPQHAIGAVLVWCGAQALLLPYGLWTNGGALGCGLLRPLRQAVAPAAATALALAAALALPARGMVAGMPLLPLAGFAAIGLPATILLCARPPGTRLRQRVAAPAIAEGRRAH